MWPPPLLDDRPHGAQVFLVFVLPALFGGLCGLLLGHSELWYTVLTTAGVLGGINAGFEHIGADEGVRRGFLGGVIFAVALIAVHLVEGSPPPFDLPAPLGVMGIVYATLGTGFGALGGWLRWRRAGRPARAT